MISMLITLLVLVLVFGLGCYLIDLLPIPANIKNIIKAILVIIAILILLQSVGLIGGGAVFTLH